MRRPVVPLLAVAALLVAAMVVAAFGNPGIEALPVELRPIASGTPPMTDLFEPVDDDRLAPESSAPSALPGGPVLVAVLVVALLAAAGFGLWYLRGRRAVRVVRIKPVRRPPTPAEVEDLRVAIEAGLTELDEGDADPRRAVIACWVRLERVAASAGTVREPGDTSTDLVARLLAAHRVDAAVLAELAARYREARFAPHPVDVATRDRVRAALRQIRDQLGVRA